MAQQLLALAYLTTISLARRIDRRWANQESEIHTAEGRVESRITDGKQAQSSITLLACCISALLPSLPQIYGRRTRSNPLRVYFNA